MGVQKLLVTDLIIIDAWMMLAARYTQQAVRPIRLLERKDLQIIHGLRREWARHWAVIKHHNEFESARREWIDKYAGRCGWPVETRNTYASILSIIGNWYSQGRSVQTLRTLEELRPGFNLYLQFSDLPVQYRLPGC